MASPLSFVKFTVELFAVVVAVAEFTATTTMKIVTVIVSKYIIMTTFIMIAAIVTIVTTTVAVTAIITITKTIKSDEIAAKVVMLNAKLAVKVDADFMTTIVVEFEEFNK